MAGIRQEIRRITRTGSARLACVVSVESVTVVSPGFARVTVRGDGLDAYRDVMPADAFKAMLPPDARSTVDGVEWDANGLPRWPSTGRAPLPRAFTVRRFDPAARRIEFDAMLHAGGLVRSWLDRARPGATIGLIGMRRDFYAGDGVTRHVIAADSSALPAVAAIVESLDPGVRATVYLAVDHDADLALVPARDGVEVVRVAGGSPAGAGSPLEKALRERERPGGRVQAWLAAEAGVVRALRRWALADLAVSIDDLHATAYWKAGLDSDARDGADLVRYGSELAAGGDPTDPGLRERVELEV
ncbi:siderophore-interacting protein [Frankia sp. CNm7]|uniref:Siderophore-interacting protein n=1 Tax=Frankia nepalensis TaxID=1836974 RepID=A0A937RL60_9ACTN|nr:siderophore-interacting protein [Frankia nepalensis]MBL7498849.1 siderophore-interacting protein [Frankia nepalensis]MBL7508654.1 siderophore-interacting protein [Frankia nepalensis]MBL7521452.1 siderophore-interacting protein [Frankia nepalensis]MBL7628433.1 siderophore-interacting protein [Frankia nepalensis]